MTTSFRHEALLYSGEEEFVDRTASFIRDGVERRELTLVVVSAHKIDLLRDALNGSSEHVRFADMADVGRNPARIIPAWRDFAAEGQATGRRLRGVGEPVWPERGGDELVECHLHESLLNLALTGSDMWLVCPYDTRALSPAVVQEALANHPFVAEAGRAHPNQSYVAPSDPLDNALPPPTGATVDMIFGLETLSAVRRFVVEHATACGLGRDRTDEVVVAVCEIASNSVLHGRSGGRLRTWSDQDNLTFEVSDEGYISDPLVGRVRPDQRRPDGRGLWIANQMCDLMQLRSNRTGTVVRLSFAR